MSTYQPELICGDLTDRTSGFPIGHVGRGGQGGRIRIGRGVHRGRGRGRGGGGRGVLMHRETLGRKDIMGVVVMVVVVVVVMVVVVVVVVVMVVVVMVVVVMVVVVMVIVAAVTG